MKSKKEKKSGKEETAQTKSQDLYYEALGRRKTSVARVRLFPALNGGKITINDRFVNDYFPTHELHKIANESLIATRSGTSFNVSAHILGGGIHSQAEALRCGIARALVKANPEYRKTLKRSGYLTRDARAKERRKFGLKKARKAPQWAKR